jgi:hypothetical protein
MAITKAVELLVERSVTVGTDKDKDVLSRKPAIVVKS